MAQKFKIDKGIIIYKLDIKDGDTLIRYINEMNNNIVATFKGIEIKGVKNEKLS